jgi:hypothetical protein
MAHGDTIPCKTCGTPTSMLSTKLCDGCWEVEHRLRDYLRTDGGRRVVNEALAAAVEEKPCPFCGSGDLDAFEKGGRVLCRGCRAGGPLAASGVVEEMKRLWNQRAAVPS